jgi:hypothetical protein
MKVENFVVILAIQNATENIRFQIALLPQK